MMSDSNSLRSNANALTLDEVFVQKAPVGSPAKCKLRLTPLSRKACLKHGIDPSALREREFVSFSKNGQDPEIQTMKYEMYSHTREKLYQVANDEREKLAAKAMAGNDSFSTADSISIASRTSNATSVELKEREISTLIENEKRRLQKAATRQQKELMRMLAFESKSKEIMDKMHAKTEEEAKKEERREKEKRKRELQAAEEARLRELRRKVKEDAEVSLQRMKIQQQFERDRKIRQRKLHEEAEAKKRARSDEQERLKKREAHRLHSKKLYEQQQTETEKKMKEREMKEKEREAKLELKRLVDAQVADAKRKDAADRISSNLNTAKQQEEGKRSTLLHKQAKQKEFVDIIQRGKQADIAERQQHTEAVNRKRSYQLRKKKESEEATKRTITSKIDQEEARLKELSDQRRKEQMLLKAEKDIQLQMKRENLERIKKAQAYHLKEIMRKAEANDQRCQDLKKRKEDLLKVRRKNAHEAKVKKDKLMAVLEQSKTAGGSSGIKKLLKSVSENGCLIESKPVKKQIHDDVESLGSPPDAPSFAKRFGEEAHSPIASYKSPYATPHVNDDFLDIGKFSVHFDESLDNMSV